MATPREDSTEPLPSAGVSTGPSKLRSCPVSKTGGGAAVALSWASAGALARPGAAAAMSARAEVRMILSFPVPVSMTGWGRGRRAAINVVVARRQGMVTAARGRSDHADLGECGGQLGRQAVLALAGGGQVARGIGRRKVAPALERSLARGGGADDLGPEHDGAAADAVAARHLVEPQDALSALHQPLDDPVDGAAVEQLVRAAGPHAGNVARQAVGPLGTRRCLPGRQILDGIAADAQL